MGLERRLLLDREVQPTDAATRRVEIGRDVALSGILLRIECTNGATSGAELLIDAIDRIEVVDGSQVLFSLEGVELYKWNWIWLRKRPPQVRSMVAGGVQELALFIPFGRTIGDKRLYLPTGRFQRPELTVEFSPTISATTFATGTFTITAVEYSWPLGEVPGATMGYLRTRQIRAFTSAASGDEDIELDRTNPYMGALVYAREAAIADGVDVTIVEVRENDGRVIPFRGRFLDIQMENQVMFDLDPVEEGIALLTDAETVDTLLSRVLSASVHLVEDTGGADANHPLARIATITADRLAMSVVEVDEAGTQADSAVATALYELHWRARGIGVGNAVFIPLALPGDIENPYMAPQKNKVQLRLTQGAAGATVRVSTQELVPA